MHVGREVRSVSASVGDSPLPPASSRALRSGVVRLVVLASLACALLPSALWAWASYTQVQRDFDEIGPLLAERMAARTRARLDTARSEIEALAGQPALAAALGIAALSDALASALVDPGPFEALVAVDSAGNLLGSAGSSAALAGLLEMLKPTSPLESDLLDAMRSVELRKQLGRALPASIRQLELPGKATLSLASAPLRGAGSAAVLHGLVSRPWLGAALHTELAGFAGGVSLVDRQGRPVASARGDAAAGGVPGLELLLGFAGAGGSRYELPLGVLDCTLVAETSLFGGLQPAARVLAQALALSLVLVVGLGALAFWRATGMAAPLWSLFTGMRKVAREGGAVEVSHPGARGEAESLIQGFNAAVQRLWTRSVETERENLALREQNEAFQTQHQTLAKLTVTDSLTKLANRRFFEEQLSVEIKRMARHDSGLSMLVIDIDDFKKLNDEFGHAAGDEFLRQIAGILKENVRATDLVARYGGEEFVVVATDTPLDGAVVLGEKLRTAVAEASFIVDGTMRPRRATISVGAAEYHGSQTTLFKAADAALYQAKAAGKNCVVGGPTDDAEPEARA
jgi:diguanylate cyclase (GGDEF)-like protein